MIADSSHARTLVEILKVSNECLDLAESFVHSNENDVAILFIDIAQRLQNIGSLELLDTELEMGL